MKVIILCSLIAVAMAVPLEEKLPLAPRPSAPVTEQKLPLNPTQKQGPIPAAVDPVKTPLHRRDTPKTPVAENNNKSPVTTSNIQKLPARDATTNVDNKNQRPNRETQQKLASATTNAPQKSDVPAPIQPSRKTREVPKKAAPTNVPQKSDIPATTAQPSRKTRDTNTKSNDAPKTPVAATNTPQKTVADKTVKTNEPVQYARVPLTNSRSRRDAPKPSEQSKIVPSGASTQLKSDSVATKTKETPVVGSTNANIKPKRDTPTNNNNYNNQAPQVRYPVPVDQVIKSNNQQQPTSDTFQQIAVGAGAVGF